jgi:hypothetical protein
MLFKKIISVYTRNHTEPINTKFMVTDSQRRWYIYLPFGFNGLSPYFTKTAENKRGT